MTKRLSTDLPDPFDNDDLFDDPLDKPLSDLDDLKIEAMDDLDDPESAQWRKSAARAPLGVGQIISGVIQVMLLAVVALALFLGIAFLLVFAGQRVGIVPARPVPGSTSVSALPTQAAQQQAATTAPEAAATSAPALPSATPDTGCPTAPSWWNSQQIQENYTYFTQTALNDARSTNNISALLEQMRIRRGFVANYAAFPCVSVALDPLLRAFDATIESARVLNAGDSVTFEAQQNTADQALAELTVALWTLGANADPAAPPALGVALNSGTACGAQTWYDAVKPHVTAFEAAGEQLDPVTTPATAARTLIETMTSERGNAAVIETPACAAQAQTLLLGALDSRQQSYEEQLGGGSNPSAAYTSQHILFLAWLRWLGVS